MLSCFCLVEFAGFPRVLKNEKIPACRSPEIGYRSWKSPDFWSVWSWKITLSSIFVAMHLLLASYNNLITVLSWMWITMSYFAINIIVPCLKWYWRNSPFFGITGSEKSWFLSWHLSGNCGLKNQLKLKNWTFCSMVCAIFTGLEFFKVMPSVSCTIMFV